MNRASHYLVAREGVVVYVRSIGLANMNNAPMLDAFLADAMKRGVRTAYVDLSSCSGMDSTFMGTLVEYSETLKGYGGQLIIIGPTEANMKLLDMLGVSVVLPVIKSTNLPDLEFVSLAGDLLLSPHQRSELIQRAHQRLAALNASNQAAFSSFLRCIQSDLAKHRAKGA